MRTRKQLRLRHFDYTGTAMYFVTINAADRRMLFGSIEQGIMHRNAVGEVVRKEWMGLAMRFSHVTLDAFIVMPNHLHGIIALKRKTMHPTKAGLQAASLGSMISQFKSRVVKRVRSLCSDPTMEIWHRNYYESIIRDERSLGRVRSYIVNNPAEWKRNV